MTIRPEDVDVGPYGRIALGAVLVEGLLSMAAPSVDGPGAASFALVAGLGAAFLALGLFPGPVVRLGPVRYFAVQMALAASITWASHAQAELPTLAVLAQAVLVLPLRAVAALFGAAIACVAASLVHWTGVVEGAIDTAGYAAAALFVFAFTGLVRSERRTRAELAAAHAELAAAHRRVAAYAAQAEELATVKERNRLARELHDSLGHTLTVTHVHVQAARALAARDARGASEALGSAARLLQDGLDDVRRSVGALRASPLDAGRFIDAIRALCADLEARGLTVRFDVRGAPRELGPAIELAVYRATQEALTNVVKHAAAREVDVTLDLAADRVRLAVRDDGAGAADEGSGFGLVGVRERVGLIGGTVEVRTAPERGFELAVEVPVGGKLPEP